MAFESSIGRNLAAREAALRKQKDEATARRDTAQVATNRGARAEASRSRTLLLGPQGDTGIEQDENISRRLLLGS